MVVRVVRLGGGFSTITTTILNSAEDRGDAKVFDLQRPLHINLYLHSITALEDVSKYLLPVNLLERKIVLPYYAKQGFKK